MLIWLCFAALASLQVRCIYSAELTLSDTEFLEDLQRRSFQYFWEHSSEQTGLTLDRTRTTGEAAAPGNYQHNIASIAATGFALTGYCIAAKRSWITVEQAKTRARTTLDFFANRAPHKEGWYDLCTSSTY